MSKEYDLKKSMEKLGQLYPIYKDQDDNILDGNQRIKASPFDKLETKTIIVKDDVDRAVIELVLNLQRDQKADYWIKERLDRMAQGLLEKDFKKGEIVKQIVDILKANGFKRCGRWVRKHLSPEFKIVTHPTGVLQAQISKGNYQGLKTDKLSFWLQGKAYPFIHYFDETPEGVVCPHFWQLKWANGCPFQCNYCYLAQTYYGDVKPHVKNMQDLKLVLESFYDLVAPMYCKHFIVKGVVLNSGELCDSFMTEKTDNPFTKFIIPLIEDLNKSSEYKHKILFLSKSNWIDNLKDIKEHESVIVSFSINTESFAKKHELIAPSPIERLEAFRKLRDWGYQDVRLRYDPLAPYPDFDQWKKECQQLIDRTFTGNYEPSWITIGSLRFFGSFRKDPQGNIVPIQGLPKFIKECGRDISVFDFDFDSNYPDGRKRLLNRKMLYDTVMKKLESIGFKNYSFCKESIGMLNLLDIETRNYKCNCTY